MTEYEMSDGNLSDSTYEGLLYNIDEYMKRQNIKGKLKAITIVFEVAQ